MNIPKIPALQKRSVRIYLALVVIVLLLGGSALFLWKTSHSMFDENQRYVVTEVRINSNENGYWSNKKDMICALLRIRPGSTNLFALNPAKLREQLMKEASIEKVVISRTLPNILNIEITERIPLALINSPKSAYVVDASCILMERNRCMDITYSLPVIIGLRNEAAFVPGMKAAALKGAVELVLLSRTDWPNLRVASISILNPNSLVCALYYKNRSGAEDIYRIVLPDTEIPTHLKRLVQILEQLRESGNPTRHINLMFKGMAVLTPPADK